MDPLTTADDLRTQAKRFRDAAAKLDQAADVLAASANGTSTKRVRLRTKRKPKPSGPTRLDQLREFVVEHGPLRRKDILNAVEMPRGSVAFLLKRENGFEQKDGLWFVPNGKPDE